MKSVSLILIVLGAVLIAGASLDKAGYLQFVTVDTTPPKFLYTYPSANMTFAPGQLDECVAYVRDSESNITDVTYSDDYSSVILVLTPYTEIKHPMTILAKVGDAWIQSKFPDIDNDGKVTDFDVDAIVEHSNTQEGDPDYNEIYDVVPDGRIDIYDVGLVSRFYGTHVLSAELSSQYQTGNVSFTFTAFNEYGLTTEVSGTFTVVEYHNIIGQWYIHEYTPLNDSSWVQLDTYETVICFIYEETEPVLESELIVEGKINGEPVEFNHTIVRTWMAKIELKPGTNILELTAHTSDYSYVNSITVTIETPDYNVDIGYVLIALGLICIIAGIILEKGVSGSSISYK